MNGQHAIEQTLGTSAQRQADFLSALASTGSVAAACRNGGMTQAAAEGLRRTDGMFAKGWMEAIETSNDALESEARRRAFEGVATVLLYAGKPVLDPETNRPIIIRKYSDSLLAMLLKANRPEKYGTKGPGSDLDCASGIEDDVDPPRLEKGRG